MAKQHRHRGAARPQNQLRIIGGQWRGRKLAFPELPGLRPTPDRVRETLFNWLAPGIGGARCLDLFAGSGALGLEALSRGATHAVMIDNAADAARQLRHNLALLDVSNAEILNQSAASWLEQFNPETNTPFDIIFLDPPFRTDMLAHCIEAIERNQLLTEDGWVYLEMGSDEPLPVVPDHWQLHREKVAGKVAYRLFEARPASLCQAP